MYFKQIPVDGFPSDTERRDFYVDSVLDQRRRKSFKSMWLWPSIWIAGALVGFVLISFFNNFHVVRADASVTATPTAEFQSMEQLNP
jgi:Na+/proline symporter